ncbi:MAG: formate/nitrite transporter family protein [Bacillota bacterium]|nr:formate/nitrite transporter family protein [Bacillota bacterium]
MNLFTPGEITKNAVEIGVKKANLPLNNMLILAILAGAYIAFAAEVSTMITHDASSFLGAGVARLLSGAIFSVGLMLVVICGAELFTGNCLLIIGVLEGKITSSQMFRNWAIVFSANFIGALLVVFLMKESGLWGANGFLHGVAAVKTAAAKIDMTFSQAFARGILANWLVCLAVWMAYASKDYVGKVVGIFFVITAFVASGFEHSIANMYFIPAGIFAKTIPAVVQAGGLAPELLASLTWQSFIYKNLIPVTLGNIVGGVLFVGMAYWSVFLQEEKTAPIFVFAKKLKA